MKQILNRYTLAFTMLFSSMLLLSFQGKETSTIQLQNLRCELLINPQGIDAAHPRLSWEINSNSRNIEQTEYHLLVASSLQNINRNIGDVWDSAKIKSDQ